MRIACPRRLGRAGALRRSGSIGRADRLGRAGCTARALVRSVGCCADRPQQGAESQSAQQRHAPLHDDECHRDGAELVVSGQVIEEELREGHPVASPGEEQHPQRGREHPPTVAAAREQRSEHGQEDRRGAEVGGPRRVGLSAPIGGQLFGQPVEPQLLHRDRHLAVAGEGRPRVAAREIGHEQVPALGPPVAPRRGVVERQPLRGGAVGRHGQLRAAADRIFRMLGRIPQRREIREHGQHASRRQHPRAAQEVARAVRPQRRDPLADPEESHRQQKIVGDLGVVGADFERGRHGGQHRSAHHRAAQREPRPRHHEGGIDQRPHLRDVARSDDEREIGREAVGDGGHDRQPRIDAAPHQGQPQGEHGEEEEGRGGLQHAPHGGAERADDELRGILDVDQVGGHASEHRPRPLGILSRFGAHRLDVARHPLVLHRVVLGEPFARELRGEIERRRDEKEYECRQRGCRAVQQIFQPIHVSDVNAFKGTKKSVCAISRIGNLLIFAVGKPARAMRRHGSNSAQRGIASSAPFFDIPETP